MSNHSKGPWKIVKFRMKREIWADEFGLTCQIPLVVDSGDQDKQEANALLIAAAPEMLDALENLENDNGAMMPASAWKLVKAAIAKAKGGADA
jgi:hypothetical protein